MKIDKIPIPNQSYVIEGGNKVKLAAQEWGNPNGKTIIFVHAWSQSHLGWLPQINSDLSENFRLITFDLRGHGQSEAPANAQEYVNSSVWAEDLNALITELKIEDLTLVGWSIGSLVVQDYVAKYGTSKLKALNIVGGFNGFNIERTKTHIGPVVGGSLSQMMAPDLGTELKATIATTKKLYADKMEGNALAFTVGYQMITRPSVRYAMVTRVVDHEETLRSLDIPLLLSHGSNDDIADIQSAKDAKFFQPKAKLSIYEGAGHAPHAFDVRRFNKELSNLVLQIN